METEARQGSEQAEVFTNLGHAYLQSARESGDGAYVDHAEQVFERALALDPNAFDAMNGMGLVFLTRHQFDTALDWSRRALAINPHRAATYGILVDAYLELGRYDAAIDAAQQMIDTRPDQASYSRVSYLRELHGDFDGAVEAMARATQAGSGNLENTAWTHVYLGHLFFHQGDLDAADRQYERALALVPNYGHALGGLGRTALARARYDQAVEHYETAVAVFGIPEYVIALGEAYQAAGRTQEARTRFDEAIATLEAERAGGMDVDEELALLLLDHADDDARALTLARGAYDRRPTIKNTSILAWALHHNQKHDEALGLAEASLDLGTKEAILFYRVGVIADAAGHPEKARAYLEQALALNPHFSRPLADEARQRLDTLPSQS